MGLIENNISKIDFKMDLEQAHSVIIVVSKKATDITSEILKNDANLSHLDYSTVYAMVMKSLLKLTSFQIHF